MGGSNIGKTDIGRSRQMREQMEDTFWFKAPSGKGNAWGKSYVRALPAHANMDGCFYWGVPIHFDVGPGQQNLPCPRRAFNQPCPVCHRGFDVRKTGDENAFKDLMPSWQAYINVVVLNEDGTPAEDPPRVRTWSVSRKVLDMLLNDMEETGDFTNLETGRDIEIRRRGEKYETEYRIKVAPEPTKFDHPVVSELRDLQLVSPYVDAETLLKALDAPAGGGDPWASEPLPPGGAREADQITQGSGSRFGPDEEEAEEGDERARATAPEKGGSAEAPATSDEQRGEARERLKQAAKPKPDK